MMQPLASPRYSELRSHADVDTENHDNPATDAADSVFGYEDEGKAWSDITAGDPERAERRALRRRHICSALMSMRSLLDTVLLLVILGLVLDRRWRKSAALEFGGDITGFAPPSE